MSSLIARGVVAEIRHELEVIRGKWLWFLILGIALIVLGTIALGSLLITALAAALALGALLLLGGIAEVVGAFWCRAWSGFFLELLSGVLGIVVGLLFLRAPLDAVFALGLLLASLLLAGGVFKIVGALMYRFASWGWVLLSGVIDLLLGVMIGLEWPWSAPVVIGVFVGISLIFRGVHWIMLALALKALPLKLSPTPAAADLPAV